MLLTTHYQCDTINVERTKEDQTMKSVKTFRYDRLINAIVNKYGFNSYQAVMFSRLVESASDDRRVMMMYNKLIQTK